MNFQQGISGLDAASRNLEVIGNNIANANTVGAKASTVQFADIYANASLRETSDMDGMGVAVESVSQQFTQGSIKSTDNPLDVAINGQGFFTVKSPSGDTGYTRDGEFQVDSSGYLVTADGSRVQGYSVDPVTNAASGILGDIQMPTQGILPAPTKTGTLDLNLDSRTAAPTAATPAFDPSNPASYTSSTSMQVYDQQGNEHVLSMFFRRTSTDNQWQVFTTMDGTSVPAGAAGSLQPSGQITFNADGSLDPTQSGSLSGGALTAGGLALDLPFSSATLPVPPSASTTTAPVTINFTGSTQVAQTFGVSSVSQDGNAPGQLTGVAIDSSGDVQASYSNGLTRSLSQVALANFADPQGLIPVGGNTWRASPESGAPAVGSPGSSSLGSLQGGALEQSNIDLTQQLVDMISAQRSYQANAQTIKTQDQMMSTLLNMR